jgi:hypothetical protein
MAGGRNQHRHGARPGVIPVVGVNWRALDFRHLPNGRLLAPECALTCARMHRVAHPKPLNRHE